MIYFAQAGEGGPIKIGHTNGLVARRINGLRTGCPEPIRVLGVVAGDTSAEKRLHRELKVHHRRGEWFDAHPDLLAAIERHIAAGSLKADPVSSRDNAIANFINVLGGLAAVAGLLGLPYTNVAAMKRRGSIPARYWWELVKAAQAHGKTNVTCESLLHIHASEEAS